MSTKINYSEATGYKQIRNYKLFEPPIGKGATGIVFKAWDNKRNQLVAIKSISTKLLLDEKRMKAFQNELKALHFLRHDNIIKIFSVEKTINNVYIALEYANGGTLSDLMNHYLKNYGTGIPESLVQRILHQIIAGLEFMHDKKHMHRDLKLDNILLHFEPELDSLYDYEKNNFDGLRIMIADLGYAKELESVQIASTLCGTPINMAAEMVMNHIEKKNERGYNLKADLWSLGSLTYEMLIGQPPFIGENLNDLFDNISKGRYKYPNSCLISIEAISFINGLLTFNADKRFSFWDMKKHPFLSTNPTNFHPVDLSIIPTNNVKSNQIEVDAKDLNNFLWIMFNHTEIKQLDKVEVKDLKDEKIMQSVCIINDNLTSDKRDMLSRFRKGLKKVQKGNVLNNAEVIVAIEDKNKEVKGNEKKVSSTEKISANNKIKEANVPKAKGVIDNNIDENKTVSVIKEVDICEEEESKRFREGINVKDPILDNDLDKNFEKFGKQSEEPVVNNEKIESTQEAEGNKEATYQSLDDIVNNRDYNGKQGNENSQYKSVYKYTSYVQCDNKNKVEEDEVWEILSCYSFIEKDNDWPSTKEEVEVLSYSNYDLNLEYFMKTN